MGSYAILFTLVYLAATLIVSAVAAATSFGGNFSANVVAVLLASFVAAWRFAIKEGRVPESSEKSQFARQALLGMWVISALLAVGYVAVVLPPDEARRILRLLSSWLAVLLLLAGVALLSLVYYVVIRWAFAWYVKQSQRR